MDETNLFECVVTDEYEGYRIDKLISELIDSFSRSYIKKLIDDKKVCRLSSSLNLFSLSQLLLLHLVSYKIQSNYNSDYHHHDDGKNNPTHNMIKRSIINI